MKTEGEQGVVIDIIVGIVGAMIGGWIMIFLGEGSITGFNLYSFIVALLGAVILIAIIKPIRRRNSINIVNK